MLGKKSREFNMYENLEKADRLIQPALDTQDNARYTMQLNENGWSAHGFRSFQDGSWVRHEKLNSSDDDSPLSAVSDLLYEVLKEAGTVNGKTCFYFRKGEPARIHDYTLDDTIAGIIEEIRAELVSAGLKRICARCFYSFDTEHNYLETAEKTDSISAAGERSVRKTRPYTGFSSDCSVVYYLSGCRLKELCFTVTADTAETSSNPCINGWAEIPEDAPDLKAFERRTAAVREGRRLRETAYASFGEMEHDVFAPLLSPQFTGGQPWPAGRPQFRCIHTPDSTVLISDGISDCFEDEDRDEKLQYNGYGAEFYMEFPGHHSFSDFTGHYSLAVLGQVCNVAIGHGGIAELLDERGALSIQLSGIELPDLWLDGGRNCGVLLHQASEAVPDSIQLNIEEAKLISCCLLTGSDLAACARDSDSYAAQLSLRLKKNGAGSFSPFTPERK